MSIFSKLSRFYFSFAGRMLFGMLAIHLVLMPTLFGGLYHLVRQDYQTQFVEFVRNDAQRFATHFSEIWSSGGQTQIIDELDDALLMGVLVSSDILVNGELVLSRALIEGMGEQEFHEDFSFAEDADGIFHIAMPLLGDKIDTDVILRLGYDEHSTDERIETAYHYALYLGSAYFILTLLIIGVSIPYLTRPLRRLRQASHEIASGNRELQFVPDSKLPEIVSLADDLEHMRRKLLEQSNELANYMVAINQYALVSVTDSAGKIIEINDKFCEISGFNREELVGHDHNILSSGLHPKAFFAELWATITSGQKWYGEICDRKKNGDLYWMDSAIVPIKNTSGKIERYITVRIDITERKRAERRLKEQNDFTDAILEVAGNVVVVLDQSGNIIRFNRVAEELTGFRKEDLLGKPVWDWVIPDDQKATVKKVFENLKNGNLEIAGRYENDWLTRDGNRITFSWHNTVLRNEQGEATHIVALGYDLTERNLIEKKLNDLNANLEARVETRTLELSLARDIAESANRAKSKFLASMSHELRTPLNSIMGFSQMLGMRANVDEEIKNMADKIYVSGSHLLELVNEVLDLATIESGKMALTLKPLVVHDLLEECRSLLTPLADRTGVRLELSGCNCLSSISADHTRLKQVILNLGSNAIKYNRKDGSVYMSCDKNSEGQIHITVRDTGPGIALSDLKDLFEPFNRLGKETGSIEGTGIGMVVTKELVEIMGFTLGINSIVDEGSTFWVEIPSSAYINTHDNKSSD